MRDYNVDLIPTRTKIGDRQADAVGTQMLDKLMSGWGLPNAKKIIRVVRLLVLAEEKRRRELKDKK